MADCQIYRFPHPLVDTLADHHPVDHGLDVVRLPSGKLGRFVYVDHLAVDPGAHEAGLADLVDHLAMFAPPPANDGRHNHRPRTRGHIHDVFENHLRRLLTDRFAALVTNRVAQPGHQQPQVIVDLGHRGHRAAGVADACPLVNGNCRLQSVDDVHVGPLELVQELPRIDRKALDILALSLGIKRVVGQRTLARPAGPGDDHQPVARNVQIHVPQIMHPRAANADTFAV